MTSLLVNPENPYHWVQIKHAVEKELREWEPGGEVITRQFDRIWTKYTGNPPPTVCVIRKSTKSACCSSAGSTGSRRSESPDR